MPLVQLLPLMLLVPMMQLAPDTADASGAAATDASDVVAAGA